MCGPGFDTNLGKVAVKKYIAVNRKFDYSQVLNDRKIY